MSIVLRPVISRDCERRCAQETRIRNDDLHVGGKPVLLGGRWCGTPMKDKL